MQLLNLSEIQEVSGGDYQLEFTAKVESGVGGWVTNLFSGVVNGQYTGTAQFAQALNDAIANGANFNQVRIEEVTFSEFN